MSTVAEDQHDPTWRFVLFIFVACLLTGLYCCELNQKLYQHHQPFYDSLSYNDKLFKVMNTARESGIADSMKWACFTNNTNCLPFIIAAVVAPAVEPSRMVGIWIQTGLLFLFLTSLFWYLSRSLQLRPDLALVGTLAFLGTKCLWLYNGGLSDFRMDLSLYLTYGMTCVWYLIAMKSPSKTNFVLLGVAASIACLFRATAPVYLVLALVPLFLVDVATNQKRKQKLTGAAVSFLVVALLAGWFFYLNFDYLKFYYVDWNTDANAKIPIMEALKHFELAQKLAGSAIVVLLLCLGIMTMLVTSRKETVSSWIARAWKEREIDWKLIWIAAAPVLMLVARRAGLNGFVSMPAVFGMVLVFLLPMLFQIQRLHDKRLYRFAWIILTLALIIAFARGWQRHGLRDRNTMAINHHLIDLMIGDTKAKGMTIANFGVVHISDLSTDCIFSTLLFDRESDKRENYVVTVDNVRLSPIPTFMMPAKADWDGIEGETDNEKVNKLMVKANKLMHYIVLPDEKTTYYLKEAKSYNFINRFLPQIRNRITQDDSWELIESGIQTDDNEFIEVYRKKL